MSSFETVVEKTKDLLKASSFKGYEHGPCRPPFYDDPEYIRVMSQHLTERTGRVLIMIIFCSHITVFLKDIFLKEITTGSHCKLDGSCCEIRSVAHETCYRHQCFETTKGIVKGIGIKRREL